MRTHATLLALAAALPLAAQTTPNLIAPTLNTPLIHESIHGSCTPLGTCTPTGLPVPTATPFPFWAGGSAWDSAAGALWVTTGQILIKQDMNACTTICGPIQCPRTPGSDATGLDLHDGNNELWVIDSAGWITQCTNACAPVVLNTWNTGFPLTGTIATSAIGIDELNGLVFFSVCNFTGSGRIYVAPLANPGAWFAFTPVFDCFPNPTLITGLAVDAANGAIFWTNGRGTYRWTYTVAPGPSVTFTPGTCCLQVAPFTDPYIDLSIRWGGATSTGTPCANGSCPACPMVHSLRNAPLLGTTLQLGLDQATPSTLALCAVDFGTCMTAGPLVAPFCGQILVPLTPGLFVLGANIPVGAGPCNASTTWLLPLPSNPIWAGTQMCSQVFTLCGASGTVGGGTQMSNCLSWVLQ
jgi:hypothetical protein